MMQTTSKTGCIAVALVVMGGCGSVPLAGLVNATLGVPSPLVPGIYTGDAFCTVVIEIIGTDIELNDAQIIAGERIIGPSGIPVGEDGQQLRVGSGAADSFGFGDFTLQSTVTGVVVSIDGVSIRRDASMFFESMGMILALDGTASTSYVQSLGANGMQINLSILMFGSAFFEGQELPASYTQDCEGQFSR